MSPFFGSLGLHDATVGRRLKQAEQPKCMIARPVPAFCELDLRKHWEEELTKTIESMDRALRKESSRLPIPFCSTCKDIQTDRNTWRPLEQCVDAYPEIRFASDTCPRCRDRGEGSAIKASHTS